MLPDRDASWNARLVKVTTWELTDKDRAGSGNVPSLLGAASTDVTLASAVTTSRNPPDATVSPDDERHYRLAFLALKW